MLARTGVSSSAAAILLLAAVATLAGAQPDDSTGTWLPRFLRCLKNPAQASCSTDGLREPLLASTSQIMMRPEIEYIMEVADRMHAKRTAPDAAGQQLTNSQLAEDVKEGLKSKYPKRIYGLHFTVVVWTAKSSGPGAAFIGTLESCQKASMPEECFETSGGLQSLAAVPLGIGPRHFAVFWDPKPEAEMVFPTSNMLLFTCIHDWTDAWASIMFPASLFTKNSNYPLFLNCLLHGSSSSPKIAVKPVPVALLVVPGGLDASQASDGGIWLVPDLGNLYSKAQWKENFPHMPPFPPDLLVAQMF